MCGRRFFHPLYSRWYSRARPVLRVIHILCRGRSKGAGMSHGNNDDVVPCMHTMTAKPEALPSAARTGKILIQSPADGDVIRSRTVKVTFDVQGKGELDDHIHVYLDGRCQNMIKHGKSYHLSGLREGKHTIELRARHQRARRIRSKGQG